MNGFGKAIIRGVEVAPGQLVYQFATDGNGIPAMRFDDIHGWDNLPSGPRELPSAIGFKAITLEQAKADDNKHAMDPLQGSVAVPYLRILAETATKKANTQPKAVSEFKGRSNAGKTGK